MAFSRQHYVAIAQVLREAREMVAQGAANGTVEYIAEELAMMFARDNARFDLTRFMDATKSGARQTPRRVY
jgi:hypothetical protein